MEKILKISLIAFCVLFITTGCNNSSAKSNANSKEYIKTAQASYKKITGLSELKKDSDLIAEVEGTSNSKTIDYKGITMRVAVVKVNKVLKGDKSLQEINILLTDALDTETPPADGEKMLLFLRKGVDNKDAYIPIGSGQGMYKIKQSKDSSGNITQNLAPHTIENKDILKDLKGEYKEIISKLEQ